jgi:hypothetical protein
MQSPHDLGDPPPTAAWSHEDARVGFEVVFIRPTTEGWQLAGYTTAVEDRTAWTVGYEVDVDRHWCTQTADVWTRTAEGLTRVLLQHVGEGRWTVNGARVAHLDGCVDVDLESSACTNTLPVHRLASEVEVQDVPAAYVRVTGTVVERLEQTYRRDRSSADGLHYEYTAPRFDFAGRLSYDRHGFVVRYPGIARRAF